jgi:2-iminobutanoate/2-iminopropanoate deaminase
MAFPRQVIMPAGRSRLHSPVPEAMRCGDWLFTSLLGPTAAGETATDSVGEARFLFRRIKAILDAAGAVPTNIAQLGVFVLDDEDRAAINVAWEEMFPDPKQRPARYIINVSPEGTHWRFASTFTAILGDNLGKVVFSPMITARSNGHSEVPPDRVTEADAMLANVKTWIEGQGGTLANVASVMAYLMDDDGRNPLNVSWAKVFPDTSDLPCRQTLITRPSGIPDANMGAHVTAIL